METVKAPDVFVLRQSVHMSSICFGDTRVPNIE